ncbi:hypothetical protein [Plantactinospora soyae]|uniref:Uncharacterized protein n=1 Tax=Plantactinospora soyae TaxID=1544732 RepID=A0A927MF38_9ACTN|nr:hypothetical protein [Plantactinospora soyae]MBE1492612.1 hypothetical protein [Plantactinospora soyae]
MSVDELRAGFARLAESVAPDEDPYALLLRRHTRRRRRVRFAGIGGGLATLLTTALLGSGVVGLGPAGPGDGRGSPRFPENGYPVTSDLSWRLIESPARGNLGDDRALVDGLTQAFVADRVGQGAAALPEAKVLFVHDFPKARSVVVAYHSDSRASLVTRMARRGASAQELILGAGIMNARVEPFLVVSETIQGGDDSSVRFTLGLAPAGCAVEVSQTATIGPVADGIRRNWRPAPGGDYALDERVPATGYWRATCDGTLRHRAPLGAQLDEVTGSAVPAAPVTPSVGATTIDGPVASAAIGSYWELARRAGFGDSLTRDLAPAVRWSGWIFDEDIRTGVEIPPAVLVSPSAPGPVLLQVGPGVKGMLALAGQDDPAPDDPAAPDADRENWSLVSTGYTNSADLITVRIPERAGGRAVLSDRLLVVGRATDASYSVIDAAGNVLPDVSPQQRGAALFTVPLGTKLTVRALDTAGRTIASTELVERDTGRQMFGESFLTEW